MAPSSLGSQERPLRVAVVGSGPSGFYAVQALFKAVDLHARVDMFDRLPTPFGLVRGGVAPDHQKIKSVTRIYEELARDARFRFFGGVMLGRDVQVADLAAHYDQIVYAVGNESDRKLGVPGEDLAGVHSATAFVGWYNAHPDYLDQRFELDRAHTVAVVGNGNVAMDVARVLLKDPSALADTDIADYALDALRKSTVREVVLLGRRGPAQAAFSPKEMEEIAALDDVDVVIDPDDATLDPLSAAWIETQPRSAQRNVKLLQELAAKGEGSARKKLRCRFLVAPVELRGSDGRVEVVAVEHSHLVADDRGTPRPKGLGEVSEVPAQMVLKAVGYRGVPIPGVPFDGRAGIIPNRDGRVLASPEGAVVAGQYVVGWAKRGPTGLIGTNSPDSVATVQEMLKDLAGKTAAPLLPGEREAVPRLLAQRGVACVTWDDWRRLDAHEQARGRDKGKVRDKVYRLDEMLRLARGQGGNRDAEVEGHA
ncbi:MAG: FAD-dependent oxidoreductase [Planctomycetota bacterium]